MNDENYYFQDDLQSQDPRPWHDRWPWWGSVWRLGWRDGWWDVIVFWKIIISWIPGDWKPSLGETHGPCLWLPILPLIKVFLLVDNLPIIIQWCLILRDEGEWGSAGDEEEKEMAILTNFILNIWIVIQTRSYLFNSKAHKSASLENLFYEFPCSLFPHVLKNCMLISLGILHLDLNSLVISAREN